MTITISLPQHVEAQIVAQAAQQNLSVEDFINRTLEQNVAAPSTPKSVSLEEFERNLDEMAQGLEHLSLPYTGTHSREDIYFDHD